MQPTYISISTLFGSQTRHTVPLFQRPYVWTQEDQWEPLWDDISGLLDRIALRQGDAQVASHFLGTIALEQAGNPTGSLPRREVSDKSKRAALHQTSRLDLNRRLLEMAGDGWDEEKIAQRANQLFDTAKKIWFS